MKRIVLFLLGGVVMTSCVSNKKFREVQEELKSTQDLLNTATVKLNSCLKDKELLQSKNELLQKNNEGLLTNLGNMTTLTQKGADNLERSLESLKEKDLTIKNLRDAVTRRDSINLALVQSLKGVLGNLDDQDITIQVDKGVVYVSISDKMLFSSGSYNVTPRAREVLGKVAKVVNNKPDFEFMVEGHTDNVPIKNNCIKDNWDLSVLRATAVVRILQNDFGVTPARMTAAGRSEYVPVTTNASADGRALNRRTRIVVLPKLDQFYNMIEQGMKDPKIN
ncbi:MULTISPECIES: OmpA/MotB family protein [unclassified Capnocytophaga]|jgi:Flagellar motor protein|uniref:OmpA/MotB family protein n=1 Tax=unclassified Capnocytophaga TaxID=2640652 RepID=UPI000202FBA8|nr:MULTISPECIES: OmpA family protein [unclassified Capnocytophaga]EGD33714.1 OmpA family protein [Capnocytophaga sp. oral taxon 338 str. F0234]MEB3004541.1 OmpA family protein [Capnocytophaga sp. G2]